jgi:hypothetical protein
LREYKLQTVDFFYAWRYYYDIHPDAR